MHDVVEVLLVDGDDDADDDDCNGSHHDEDANDDDEYDVGGCSMFMNDVMSFQLWVCFHKEEKDSVVLPPLPHTGVIVLSIAIFWPSPCPKSDDVIYEH